MCKEKTLDELFENWKKHHSKESEDSCKKTFPKMPQRYEGIGFGKDFKNNWTIDGYLNEKDSCKILFILKESNIEELADKHFVTQESVFWLKTVRDKYRKKIPRRLKKLTTKLLGDEYSSNWYDYAATLNINKRGGFRECTFYNLMEYAKEYSKEINNQIEIINPEKIVFLGREFYDNKDEVLDIITECKGRELHFYAHPSTTGRKNSFNDEKFLKEY